MESLHIHLKCLQGSCLHPFPYDNYNFGRSNHSQTFFKIGVLKNLAIFTEKHLCYLCPSGLLFIKKRLQHSRFLVNFAKFLRTAFLKNTSTGYFYFDSLREERVPYNPTFDAESYIFCNIASPHVLGSCP